jgi:hypothetical protein
MSRDMWWMDGEDGEQEEEYEEYFDVERRMWVRVPKTYSAKAYEGPATMYGKSPEGRLSSGAGVEVYQRDVDRLERGDSTVSEERGYTESSEESGEASRDEDSGGSGWVVFDTNESTYGLLRGRGARKPRRQLQHTTGLKLYIVMSSLMAGLLAVSGRFLELGVVGASMMIVLFTWRWRRWA